MHGHKISNVNNYVQNINYIQNIPISINKLFYEYILKLKNDLSDMDQRTIELAGILFDVEFYFFHNSHLVHPYEVKTEQDL